MRTTPAQKADKALAAFNIAVKQSYAHAPDVLTVAYFPQEDRWYAYIHVGYPAWVELQEFYAVLKIKRGYKFWYVAP